MTDFIDYRDTKKDEVISNDSTTVPFSINNSNFIDYREPLVNQPKSNFIDYREPLVNQPNVIAPTTNTNIPVVSNNQLQPEPKVDLNLTEDMLRKDPQWIKDAKTIYKERTGKPFFGTNEEAANWLLDDQSWMGWNFTSMGKRAFESSDWDKETAEAYLRTINTYPESDTTLRSVLSAIGYSIADLPTLGSLGWSLIAKAIGGKPAQLAARYSFKEQLKKRITQEALKKKISPVLAKEIAERSGKGLFKKDAKKKLTKLRRDVALKTGIKNLEIFAPLGFAYAGLFDIGTQNIRKNVDPNKDDIDYIDSLISAGLGATIGAPIAMIAPQVAGIFGRRKFFKNALEDDIIYGQAVPDNTTSLDLLDTKQIKQLSRTANVKNTKNNALEETIKEILPGENVLSLGGGRYVSSLKGVPEAQAIEKAGGKASVYELLPNVERQDVPLGTFITPNKLNKKNYDKVLMQNVFGLIPKDDEIVGHALIQDAAKSMKKDGTFIVNVGPQIKTAGQTKRIKEPVSIRDQRKGEIIEPKKRPVDFEEVLDPKDLKPVGPKDSPLDEQGRLITEQITTSLGERDLVRMLMNNFKNVTSEMVNGERIYKAKRPIIYTPNTLPKFGNKTIFQKIGQLRRKYFNSNAALPDDLVNKFVNKKAIQRGAGKNVEAVWNKLERAIHNRWTNPAGEKFSNWTQAERDAGAAWLDAALKGLNIADPKNPDNRINARDALPKFLREQIDDMRLTMNDLQQTLIDIGYIKRGTEFHTEFVSRMGVKDNKGILRATRDKDGLIEMHINRQYEITNPSSNYLKRLYNTPAGLQKIAAARKLFRNELLSSKVAEDISHPLRTKAIEAQRLKSIAEDPFDLNRPKAKLELDEIIGEEGSFVDNLVEDFLSKYTSKDLNEIANSFGGSVDDFLMSGRGAGGSQGVKAAFYKRKNIPPILRDLMGEYKDPFINYGNTMMKLHQTINNYAFENEIRKLVRQGKFPGLETPRINMLGDEAAPLNLGKDFKNLGEASQLARNLSIDKKTGKLTPGTDLPLENIKAENIIFDAVQMGNDIAPLMNPGWKQFLKLQALTRISKTAYSFAAQPRNFIGAFLKAVAAGNLNIPQFLHTVKVMRGIGKLNDDKLTAQLEKWASLDILGSGAKIGSLREALEETGEQTMLNNQFRLDKAKQYFSAKGALHQGRRFNNFVLDFYQSMDDMWKVYSFLNERKRYKQVLLDKDINPNKVIRSWRTIGGEKVEITALDDYAAKMVGRHMDNYGNTARMVKYARRLPAADFLAYKTEQFRTVNNIFKTSFQDMKEGRDLLYKSKGKKGRAQLIQGFQRFGSIISAIGIPMGIAGGYMWNPEEQDKVIKNIGGVDYILPYSKAEAERETSIPDYAAGDHYMPIGTNKDGTKKFLNLTYWDPLGPFRQPIMAALRATQGGRPFDEAMDKAFKDVGDSLMGNFGPSMLSEAIFAVVFDLDQYGNKITQPGDKIPDKMKDKFLKFMAAFKPNAMKEVQRVTATTDSKIPFFTGEGFTLPTGEKGSLTEKGGFPMGRSTAIKRAVGFPEMVTDIKTSLPFKAAPIGVELRDAPAIFKQELKLYKNLSEKDIINSYKKAVDYEYNAMRKLSRLYVAAQAAGMDVKDVWDSLTAQGTIPNNFKQRDIIAFVRGDYIPKVKIFDKDLLGHMRRLYSKGQVRSKLMDVQKELLEIRESYQGAPLFPSLERVTPEREYSPSNIIDFRN